MSHQERRIIVSLVTGVAILAAYITYASQRYQSGSPAVDNLRAWAITMLVFIGIGIIATIVIQIIFHILSSIGIAIVSTIKDNAVDEKDIERSINVEMAEDEMDHLIDLKSMRVGFAVAGTGFAAGLIMLALGYPAALMLNVLFVSFSASSLIEGFTQLYFYRRGVRHG